MPARDRDILVVALLAAMAVMSVLAPAGPALRTLLGMPLVFCLPGYAILRAAFREPKGGLAGAIFAVGLSIAVTVFCGLILHLLGGLSPKGWAVGLGMVTLLACAVAYARRRRAFAAKRRSRRLPALAAAHAAMIVCAGVIAISTVALARHWRSEDPQFTYTELWMVPHRAGGGAFTIGVRNAERTPVTYDLELLLDERIVAMRRSIQLGAGETWRSDFTLPMAPGAAHAAEARLFRTDADHRVYRRVWLKTAPES